MKANRAQVARNPLISHAEIPALFGSKGYLLRFNEFANGLSTADSLGGVDNNDTAKYFSGGNATITGTGNPLVTNPGYITPNGTDNYIQTTETPILSAFDLTTLADDSDHVVIVFGALGGQPTADEYVMDYGTQFYLKWDSSGTGKTQLTVAHDAGSETFLNANPTPNPFDGSYRNTMIDIHKTDANTFVVNRWIDGTAGPGWTWDATGRTIGAFADVRGLHLFSDGYNGNLIGSNGSAAQFGYKGMFRITQDITSELDNIALQWHKANPGPDGAMPVLMRDY